MHFSYKHKQYNMRMQVKMSKFVLRMVVCSIIFKISMAATYTVGGPDGSWDESTNLQAWANPIKFVVGDKLVFIYAKTHDVVEVPKSDYAACETTNAIITDKSGKSVVPLKKAGKRYFICGVPGHCSNGMKLEVNVVLPSSSSLSSASVAPTMPPVAEFGSPLASIPTEPPLSSMPSSSAGQGSSNFKIFVGFLVSALVVLAF